MTVRGADYTKSAINLTHPLEVKDLLIKYDKLRQHTLACVAALAATPQSMHLDQAIEAADKAKTAVKEAIDKAGSYQDITEGLYAIKQKRVSTTYEPSLVRKHMPDFAAIISEFVPSDKVKGLLKGDLITFDQVIACQSQAELSPAYIIDVLPSHSREVRSAD